MRTMPTEAEEAVAEAAQEVQEADEALADAEWSSRWPRRAR